MGAIASILLTVGLGVLVVYRFAGFTTIQPRWAAWLLTFGVGSALGAGITAVLFFLFVATIPGGERLALWSRLAILVAIAYDCWRKRALPQPMSEPQSRYAALLWIAFAVALVIVTYGMSAAWQANPEGNSDAWAIWNLRARFLAGGHGVAARAWSPMLNFTHSEYPLLLSSFVASCWADAGTISNTAPIAISYLFFLALLSTVTGGVAALRGAVLGILAGICLMAIPPLLAEVPAQYADVPLACFLSGATLFLLLDRPAFAGSLAGLAAWTKDEGLLFLAVLFAALAIVKRSSLLRFIYGAAPLTALVLVFKLVMTRGTNSLMSGAPSGLASKLTDFSRYQITLSAMLREIPAWAVGWYHPLLPIAVLAILLRFDRRRTRDALFCSGVAGALLLGYFAVYIVTPNDLHWQLQTSLTRLFVQICPLVLIAAFVSMRAPELARALEPPKQTVKRQRRQKARP